MRKMIFSSNVSLDGYISGPDGRFDFAVADAELHETFIEIMKESDLLVFGRKTYKLMVDAWPLVAKDPSSPAFMLSFANTINPMKKIVFSKSLKSVGWNTILKREIDPEEIKSIKAQPGKTIMVSGPNVGQQLMKHGLIDEILILVHPVILGGGKPFFGDTPLKLELLRTKTLRSGAVMLHYRKK